jgi:glycerol-3-phosphate acyltransferase PlsX
MSVRTILLDAMGGDHGPSVCVDGAVDAVVESPTPLRVTIVGDKKQIDASLHHHIRQRLHHKSECIDVVDAPDFVRMDESPTDSLKRKDTSIRVGLRLLKDGRGDAFVSTGNTGAVMAAGLADLGRLGGVSRPAIATVFPTQQESTLILDVGANSMCKPQHLVEFAIMGACYMQAAYDKTLPRVGLLSIGEEPSKGTELTVATHKLLAESGFDFKFIGNIEGRDILSGKADVVVCDGFVGNILLKFAESLQGFLTNAVRRQIKRNYFSHAGAILMGPFLRRMRRTFDYAEYGGAPLLGLNGLVVICHGSSSAKAIKNAIWSAANGAEHHVNQHIIDALASYKPAPNGVTAHQA